MHKIVSVTIFFSILLLVTSCKKFSDVEKTPDQPSIEKIKITGMIELPEGIDTAVLGELKIISGMSESLVYKSEAEMKANGRKMGGATDDQLFCRIETIPNSVKQFTVLNGGDPFMYGLVINSNQPDQRVIINDESTAIAIVFTHPFLLENNPNDATLIVEKIKKAESFNLLKDEIRHRILEGRVMKMDPNIQNKELVYYNRVVVETLTQLADNFDIEQNGLKVIENKRKGDEIQFRIRNYRKRYIAVYAHKYIDGKLINTDIKTEGENFSSFGWVSSGEYSYATSLMQVFKLQFKDQIVEDSKVFSVNVKNAKGIYLKCYGLGTPWPSMGSEEFQRGLLPFARSAIYDIILPFYDIIDNLKPPKGLIGRSDDDPVDKLIKRFADKVSKDYHVYAELFNSSISTNTNNNWKVEVLKVFLNAVKDFILDEDNAKLYLDIFRKNATNADIELFKKALRFSPVIKAADITQSSVNIFISILDIISSRWTTEFMMGNDGSIEPIPTEGLVAYYPFNGNANDESGNGNDGVVNGATLTSDRKGFDKSAYKFRGFGFGDKIVVNNSQSLTFGDEISISLWAQQNTQTGMDGWGRLTANGSMALIAKDWDRGGFDWLQHNNASSKSQTFRFGVNNKTDGSNIADYLSNSENNIQFSEEWKHFVMVYYANTGLTKFFINGEMIKSSIVEGQPGVKIDRANFKNLLIGSYLGGLGLPQGWYPFNGRLDDIRIYNRALNENEIIALYNE